MDALLVSLTTDMIEMRALLDSAGHRVADVVVQRRDRPDPRTFVGRGKLREIRERVERGGIDFVVFNGELRPTMHYHLERELGVECYDRLRVILELFAQRAAVREAKLQVELALLRYEVPLLREWIHEGEVGERPGFMAGGAQRVDAYYETVKRRMKKIGDELESIRRGRELRRVLRKDRGFHLVALSGYANAGKSSLLNALTGEHVVVEDRMFSTLSTTTRILPEAGRVLLTDTVGLVDGIPFWMIEAFIATLEEIFRADLVLLLVDASDPEAEVRRKVRLAARTLLPRVAESSILPVLTKTDVLAPEAVEDRIRLLSEHEFHRTPLAVSSRTGQGLETLRTAILGYFAYPIEVHLLLPLDEHSGAALHWLHERTQVIAVVYGSSEIAVTLRCQTGDRTKVGQLGRVVFARDVATP